MKIRLAFFAALAFGAATVWAQPQPPSPMIMNNLSMPHRAWFPDQESRTFYVNPATPPTRYAADLRETFAKDPERAKTICALITFVDQSKEWAFPVSERGNTLRKESLSQCKAYPYTKEQYAAVAQWFAPPKPPSRLEATAGRVQRKEERGRRYLSEYGIYAPPPAEPADWLTGAVPGRDYKKDVSATFEKDPLTAAVVCASAEKFTGEPREELKPLRTTLTSICKTIPETTFKTALNAENQKDAELWIAGLLNSLVAEVSVLPAGSRRMEADGLVTGLEKRPSSQQRFLTAVRALVFAPEDLRGADALLRYMHESALGPPWATKATVSAAFSKILKLRASDPSAGPVLKRAERAWLIINGKFEEARPLARELAGSEEIGDRATHAFVERVSGDRIAFDNLMKSCPPPDELYLQQYGAPARRPMYCEELIAGMSRVVYDQLGSTAPAAVAELLIETNRATAQWSVTGKSAQQITQSPGMAVLADAAALIHRELEAAEKLSKVERDATAERIRCNCNLLSHNFEESVRMFALRPGYEMAVGSVIYASRYLPATTSAGGGDPRADLRKAFGRIIEKKFEETGSPEWTRALRNYLLFSGQYARALQLAHELRTVKDPEFAGRDAGVLGLLELVNGNTDAYRQALVNCPGQPEVSIRTEGAMENPASYCMMVAWSNARRILEMAGDKPSPPQIRQIMIDMAGKSNDVDLMLTSAAALQEGDPAAAERIYRQMMEKPKQFTAAKVDILFGLMITSRNQKRWAEALSWADRLIAEVAPDEDHPIPPKDAWKALAALPEANKNGTYAQTRLTQMLRDKLIIAMEGSNWAAAKETIDRIVPYALQHGDGRSVRIALFDLATRQLSRGMREEPLRILGFLAAQPLDYSQSERLNELRRQAGGSELRRFDTPWESKELPRFPRRQPTPADVKTSKT